MDLHLKNKTVIVTGGTLGIGRAIAEQFADEGANVAICARDADRVAKTVENLKARGVRAFGRALDAGDGIALEAFVAEVEKSFGGIDVFVSNASSLAHGDSPEAWKLAFEVDVLGAVRAARAALPSLFRAAEKHGDASFLTISSMAATQVAEADAYGAMKAALMNFTKGHARAHAARRVRFNTISPGTIYSDDGSWGRIRRQSPERYEMMLAMNPTGRMGTPSELAAAALFLSSPVSGFTTGANLVIDGCMSFRVNY